MPWIYATSTHVAAELCIWIVLRNVTRQQFCLHASCSIIMALGVHGPAIEIAIAAGDTHHAISVSLQQMSPFETFDVKSSSWTTARENSTSLSLPQSTSLHGPHKIQNEKLAMYGVTHVMAVDGFSRKIVGMISIPTKNPISIYNALTRPLLLSYGLWQQVRLDHGSEFVLVITAQQHLSNHRQWQDCHPVLQSISCQNHRVERMWPEGQLPCEESAYGDGSEG